MHPGQGQSYSADERSDVQPEFVVVPGLPGFIAHGGRLMARVAGGETNGAGAPAGVAEPGADGAEGQGEGLGLYDLTTVPEHLRPIVEPELKKIEANVTKRFEEAAAFRKQWEPLSAIEGLTDLQPDALKELVEFHQGVLSDPEAFKAWWTQLGEQAGWMQDVSGGDGGEDGGDDLGGDDPPAIAEIRQTLEGLTTLVEQLAEGQQTSQATQRTEAAKQAITAELEALAGEHLGEGQKFDDDTREAILTFAWRYQDDPEAIAKGFADLQKVKGQSQSSLVEDKLVQPSTALRGGPPDTAPTEITSFAEAKQLARARREAGVGT